MPASKNCPICNRPQEAAFRPFCSKRCADVDLGRWFNESYIVPEPVDPETVHIRRDEDGEIIH
jgi:endogenous inhibitor of DNA gyrase (YacG/DUF329 family)